MENNLEWPYCRCLFDVRCNNSIVFAVCQVSEIISLYNSFSTYIYSQEFLSTFSWSSP